MRARMSGRSNKDSSKVDLGAFDIDLEHPDLFIEILNIADEVYLPDLDGVLFGDDSSSSAMIALDSEYKAGLFSNRACR